MARRPLVVWIESAPLHCDGCAHWECDIEDGSYRCRAFDVPVVFDVDDRMVRHPECLRAETFAGG